MNFLINIEELRARARKQIEDGAVTENYKLDRDRVVAILIGGYVVFSQTPIKRMVNLKPEQIELFDR
jgi:hypothetical protein